MILNLKMTAQYIILQSANKNFLHMKKHLVFLFAAILMTASSCQTATNPENEEKALLEVLEKEAAALVAGDMEGVFALHTQDSKETRLEMGIYGYNTYEGWDAIKVLLEDAAPGLKHTNAVNHKENVISKVNGNSAWLKCDNIWKWDDEGGPGGYNNLQVVFFEKIKGEWKISFASYYSKAVPVQQ